MELTQNNLQAQEKLPLHHLWVYEHIDQIGKIILHISGMD